MEVLMQFLRIAAIVQIAIAGANFFLPRKLNYKENLERVTPIIRQVFVVHSVYIVGVVLLFAGCQGSQVGAKRWSGGIYGQGNEERQKYRAASFDPYPLNDIGPEVVGGRPRG